MASLTLASLKSHLQKWVFHFLTFSLGPEEQQGWKEEGGLIELSNGRNNTCSPNQNPKHVTNIPNGELIM